MLLLFLMGRIKHIMPGPSRDSVVVHNFAYHEYQVVLAADRVDAALLNAKLSQRGSIRKAHNVITWAGVLRQLKKNGVDDPTMVVRKWNDMAGMQKDNKIQGAKRSALLNLMALEPKTLDKFMGIVSEFTWEACPFTEDFLASPKLKLGVTIRCTNKEWAARFRIADEALLLFCDLLRVRVRKTPVVLRKSVVKADLEDLLHLCAMAHNMVEETQNQVPIADEKMDKDPSSFFPPLSLFFLFLLL